MKYICKYTKTVGFDYHRTNALTQLKLIQNALPNESKKIAPKIWAVLSGGHILLFIFARLALKVRLWFIFEMFMIIVVIMIMIMLVFCWYSSLQYFYQLFSHVNFASIRFAT